MGARVVQMAVAASNSYTVFTKGPAPEVSVSPPIKESLSFTLTAMVWLSATGSGVVRRQAFVAGS